MFERIVVAYDESESSEGAARLAFRLGGARSAQILLVNVIEELERLRERIDARPELRRLLDARREKSLAALDALSRMAAPGTHIESRVICGNPAGGLIQAVREHQAGLVAMGTHGVGGWRSLLGSVSHKLVEQAPCPVLLVRGQAPPADLHLTVLAALDGSTSSLRALGVAEALAIALDASLRLVHVVEIPAHVANELPASLADEWREEARDLVRAARSTLTAPLEVSEDLLEGDPREGLIRACDRHAPAILVMATRGVGGFSGLIGSTTRFVVNEARCPILVTRAWSA